jgi:lysophospholipase L1-like esterase
MLMESVRIPCYKFMLFAVLAFMLGVTALMNTADATETDTDSSDRRSYEPAAMSDTGLNYVALGDSITAGYGIETGYVTRYAAYIESDSGRPVAVANLGRNGWTSTDLLRALRESPGFQDAVRNADLVTWKIGTNDLREARLKYKFGTCGGKYNQRCLRTATQKFKANWNAITQEVMDLRSGRETALRTATIYYPYVRADKVNDSWKKDGGLKDFQVLSPYYHAVNRHVSATAADMVIPCAGVYAAFNGASGEEDPKAKEYLLPDWVHPNETGHEVIAGLLRDTGYAPPQTQTPAS